MHKEKVLKKKCLKTRDAVWIGLRDLRKRQLLYVLNKEFNLKDKDNVSRQKNVLQENKKSIFDVSHRSPWPTIRLVGQVICKDMNCPRQEPTEAAFFI